MNLERVTITGADDSTNIDDLMALSHAFPFVEWGILVSPRQEGSPRFPSRDWMCRFVAAAREKANVNISTHICGEWVRQLLVGDLSFFDSLPPVLSICKRIQINTHGEVHTSTTGMWKSLEKFGDREFIFQWDGVNDHLAYAAGTLFKRSILFDTSHGAGVEPKEWKPAPDLFRCGYAGGIGPDNVLRHLEAISRVCGKPFWIDMERKVRTPDDSALDMNAVRRVIELSKQFMESTW